MSTKTKVMLAIAATLLVLCPIGLFVFLWFFLEPTPAPGTDVVRKLGCKDAWISVSPPDAPKRQTIIHCKVDSETNAPRCDALAKAYRERTAAAGPVLVEVALVKDRQRLGVLCNERFDPPL